MIESALKFSIRFKGVVIALAALFCLYAVIRLQNIPFDVFPEFSPPQIGVQTEAPGLSPEQVEVLVTTPIENALNGLSGLTLLHSDSIQGLSVLSLTFENSIDPYLARQMVAEKLASVPSILPQGVSPPTMAPLVSSTGDLLAIGLVAKPIFGKKALDLMQLREVADKTVARKLQSVPGVANASLFGGEVKQLQIQIHSDRLVEFGLAFDDVVQAARKVTGIRGAGLIDTPNQRITLQTEDATLNPADLARMPLVLSSASGITLNLALGDVAKITFAPAPAISAASINGKPGVIVNVWGQFGANTLVTTQKAETVLREMTPMLNALGIDVQQDVFRAANFLETALANIKSVLLLGIFLVMVVLFLFLANFRSAAISCTVIPISLFVAILALNFLGQSLNIMTLAGLAIAIGEIVDDAVIDVENILRRLKENSQLAQPLSKSRVVFNASMEIRTSVVFATLAVILVFIPVLSLSGLTGHLFAPLGYAYIFAILASLIVALTLTPALCVVLLSEKNVRSTEPKLSIWLRSRYQSLLGYFLNKSKYLLILSVGLFFLAVACVPFLKMAFLPDFKEGHFLVHMTMLPGTSLNESLRLGSRISEALLKIPEVRIVGQRVGRAQADDTFGTHASEFEIDLKPEAVDRSEEVSDSIREVLESFPGARFEINTFLAERIEETLTGYTAPVVVTLVGDDLDILESSGQAISALMQKVAGARDVQLLSPSQSPQLKITLKHANLAHWGIDSVTALETISSAYEGTIVGQVYEGDYAIDVNVLLADDERNLIENVSKLKVENPDGSYVRLGELADIKQVSGRYGISHDGSRRVQTVLSSVAGRDVVAFVREVQERISQQIKLPPGMYVEFGGEAEAQSHSQRDLIFYSILSVVAIFLVFSLSKSLAGNLRLLFVNLPFGMIGGILALTFAGGELSLGALIGFVTLFGISLRNSIMMMAHYVHLVREEGRIWDSQTAIIGASERLVPVLMTALITFLGLLPLVLNFKKAGMEIEGPMAIVIAGGLVTSTVLNLLLLPILSLHFGRLTLGSSIKNH